MNIRKILLKSTLAIIALFSIATALAQMDKVKAATSAKTIAKALTINNDNWQYNADNKVYYQVGIKYATKSVSTKYESMGIFVPAAYVKATQTSKGYHLTINNTAKINGYTAKTAPMVMPINTPGYAAQAAPTAYDSNTAQYTKAGFIYILAGCRGRDATDSNGGSPWGVVDLKAAVRTLRLNAKQIPGDTHRIFTFGHSGGGAQSALMGATGNAKAYTPYLKQLGAATTTASGQKLSDAITGAMIWCPITSLTTADEAYEWNMGQYATTGTRKSGTFTKALSNDMASHYAKYINQLGLKENGKQLSLEKSQSGIYTKGSYYQYLMTGPRIKSVQVK